MYGIISRLLTELLKKDEFEWSPESERAFEMLKEAIATAPVLALPDFSKNFILESDAADKGVGAVLVQEGRPLSYLSKASGPKHIGLSIYEKEF